MIRTLLLTKAIEDRFVENIFYYLNLYSSLLIESNVVLKFIKFYYEFE